ncbi:MAG: formyltransferase family protein, partial [Xanthomonadales bacterium]|nr:formyltransferase family protein [Xanthomonadales bacterium]
MLNAHHGDLPAYRGNACTNWALLRDESEIVCSVHLMEGGRLDCGRVIVQEAMPVLPSTVLADVYQWSESVTPGLFVKAVRRLEADPEACLKYADPNASGAFRCFPRLLQDSWIDWAQPPREVHNLIRASSEPLPGAYTFLWEEGRVRKLRVLQSRVVVAQTADVAMAGHVLKNDAVAGESLVRCGRGVLALLRCRYEDEAAAFAPGERWHSIRKRLGVNPADWLWALQTGAGPADLLGKSPS